MADALSHTYCLGAAVLGVALRSCATGEWVEVTVRASADEVRAALLDIFPGARCCVMAHFHGDGSRSANRDVCALLPLLRRLGSQVLAASDGWYGAWQPVRLKEQSVHERKA